MMPQAFSIVNTIGTFSAAIMNPSLGTSLALKRKKEEEEEEKKKKKKREG